MDLKGNDEGTQYYLDKNPDKTTTGRLQTNIPYEHRCKNLQQSTSNI